MLLRSLSFLCFAASLVAADIGDLQRSFDKPPDDARIMMRWWWFGPAVTKPQLEREMNLMKAGGIGGFEVQPVYPLALDDEKVGIRNLPYLSAEFLDALRFTSDKARELGLRMDVTLGSGWPYGGPSIPVAQAAGTLRVVRVKPEGASRRVAVPDIGEGESLIAAFAGTAGSPASLREVKEIREGALYLPAGVATPVEVVFFVSSRTGQMVKRAAVGAEGFVLDHYNRAALGTFLKTVADPLMRAFDKSQPPHAIFCDSLEVYNSNWTPGLLDEFGKRRGYDLRPNLPALIADMGTGTADIRRDYFRTLTELAEERFLAPMQEWAKKNKTLFRIQGYGTPPVVLSSYSYVDLPEGEGAAWKTFSTSRWAASASHMLGRPVTSSETWTWLHSPSFRATPLDVKVEADRHFLQGINQLIGHGWPYTAEGMEYPGWRFYAAAVFGDKNPWWIAMPDLSLYLQRTSHMLRQGTPVNDIAIYMSNSDAWSRMPLDRPEMNAVFAEMLGPTLMSQLLEAGYNFDFFDDALLERGALAAGANRHRIVLLPGVERIPASTLRALAQLERAGVTVVATRRRPEGVPGLFVENEADLVKTLSTRLRPDVAFSPAAPELGFVHRRADTAEIYFLANTGYSRQSVRATVRVEGMQPEWWDPVTGRVGPADIVERTAGATGVAAEFEPYESRFLIFTRRNLPRSGRALHVPEPVDLSGGWQVSFGRSSTPVRMDRLRSWTDDEATRFYSGVASYERDVIVPAALLQDGLALRLDFGQGTPAAQVGPRLQALLDIPVRDAAVIYVNERRAGAAWCPPFLVDVTSLLKPGVNHLRVEVGNTAINHLAGHSLPDYRLLNLRYGVRFEPQDMKNLEPLPSGLLGTVRLVVGSR